MREVLTFILRTGLFSAGVLLFYASLSYETEDGQIQNLLEEWWIKVDDYQRQALSKHIAFLKMLASVSTRVFDQLFGPKVLSVQAIGVSLCLSDVCLGIMSLVIGRLTPNPKLSISSTLWLIVFSVTYGIIPMFLQRIRKKVWRITCTYLWFVVLLIKESWGLPGLILVSFFVLLTQPQVRVGAAVLLGILFLIFLAEALFISLVTLMRWTVRAIWQSQSAIKIISLFLVNVLPPFVLTVMIMGVFFLPDSTGPAAVIVVVSLVIGIFGLILNFPFFLSALVFALLAMTMLVHRLFWPAIARPLYKLQAMGVAKRPLLFRGIGLLLVSASIGWHQWIWFVASKL